MKQMNLAGEVSPSSGSLEDRLIFTTYTARPSTGYSEIKIIRFDEEMPYDHGMALLLVKYSFRKDLQIQNLLEEKDDATASFELVPGEDRDDVVVLHYFRVMDLLSREGMEEIVFSDIMRRICVPEGWDRLVRNGFNSRVDEARIRAFIRAMLLDLQVNIMDKWEWSDIAPWVGKYLEKDLDEYLRDSKRIREYQQEREASQAWHRNFMRLARQPGGLSMAVAQSMIPYTNAAIASVVGEEDPDYARYLKLHGEASRRVMERASRGDYTVPPVPRAFVLDEGRPDPSTLPEEKIYMKFAAHEFEGFTNEELLSIATLVEMGRMAFEQRDRYSMQKASAERLIITHDIRQRVKGEKQTSFVQDANETVTQSVLSGAAEAGMLPGVY